MNTSEKLALVKSTSRKIWDLTTPYFNSDEKWKARGLLLAIVLLNFAYVYNAVLFNDWQRTFFDAIEKRDAAEFGVQLLRWLYLGFAFIVIAVYKFYLTQLLELRWRTWLTKYYLQRWLTDQAFYRMELGRFSNQTGVPDNPDQRIQEDLAQFTDFTLTLTMGALNALITLFSFVGVLWGLSGGFAFSFAGYDMQVHGYMVWAAVGYCVMGSIVTHYIGRPQIGLNFRQQRYEADFRHHMVRVREYCEAIALDKGENVERFHLDRRFLAVATNYLQLIRARKNLVWFASFFGQAALVFPYLVAAPRFFANAITFGQLQQIASAFNEVNDSLSWFIDNYNRLAIWRATADRLTSFEESVVAQTQAQRPEVEENASGLAAHDLTLQLPTGATLLSGLSLRVAPGDSVLIMGPSGSGKSTLFRAFAGIWPFAKGKVDLPADTMAIPQNPYFPDGPLRDALAYPEPAAGYSDEALRRALEEALLPQLMPRLDDHDAWSQKLSGGERQRLALARVFLKQPAWVLADEATSALDESAERTLYQRLAAMVKRKGGAMVSIAHRPALDEFHARRWQLEAAGDGGAAYRLRES